jgi:hypothetical protein
MIALILNPEIPEFYMETLDKYGKVLYDTYKLMAIWFYEWASQEAGKPSGHGLCHG